MLVAPAIQLRPVRSAALTAALRDLSSGDFAWIVLTSPATVRMLDERIETPREVRAQVAAVGEGTAAAFARWARRDPELVPRSFTVGSLARAFPRGSGRVLCARADIAPRRSRGRARGQGVGADKGRCLPDHVPAIAARRGAGRPACRRG